MIDVVVLADQTRRAGDRKIFSVIAEDNTATQVIAMRNRTRQVATYFSQKAGKPVGIWMPEWKIDTNEIASPGQSRNSQLKTSNAKKQTTNLIKKI